MTRRILVVEDQPDNRRIVRERRLCEDREGAAYDFGVVMPPKLLSFGRQLWQAYPATQEHPAAGAPTSAPAFHSSLTGS